MNEKRTMRSKLLDRIFERFNKDGRLNTSINSAFLAYSHQSNKKQYLYEEYTRVLFFWFLFFSSRERKSMLRVLTPPNG